MSCDGTLKILDFNISRCKEKSVWRITYQHTYNDIPFLRSAYVCDKHLFPFLRAIKANLSVKGNPTLKVIYIPESLEFSGEEFIKFFRV